MAENEKPGFDAYMSEEAYRQLMKGKLDYNHDMVSLLPESFEKPVKVFVRKIEV